MNDLYRLVIENEAFQYFLNRRVTDRRMLNAWFDELARQPFTNGHFREMDNAGRPREVAIKGKYAVTFWADHAAKELRIVRVETIQLL